MINLPTPYAAARIAAFLAGHPCWTPVLDTRAGQPCWTAFWDKRFGLWRVAENDPDSDLYAASRDADTVIAYITTHS